METKKQQEDEKDGKDKHNRSEGAVEDTDDAKFTPSGVEKPDREDTKAEESAGHNDRDELFERAQMDEAVKDTEEAGERKEDEDVGDEKESGAPKLEADVATIGIFWVEAVALKKTMSENNNKLDGNKESSGLKKIFTHYSSLSIMR